MRLIIQRGDDWLAFREPVEILTARTRDEVVQCLEKIEESRCWAAGFVSYEAAGAFDEVLQTHAPGSLPLLCFGLFESAEKVPRPASSGAYTLGEWRSSVARDEYTAAIRSVKERIAAGDTYQVNYTFRLNAQFAGDPFVFFCDLAAAQQGAYAAFVELDGAAICSASPELFFELKDGVLASKPMKGTRPRGLTATDDRAAATALRSSEKDRAENIMIVDMIRNDIGRVAEPGGVETLRRFDLEKYPTVWQMTSTVQGAVGREASLSEVFGALFPCASITGAPKAKTMEIIRQLETTPRGIYTGSIGFVAPDGTAQFNVAIRTAVIQDGRAEYGIGGGIVWDSDAAGEYEEALSKAAILTKNMPEFELLETLLYDDGELFLLERHLRRLADSADYFGFSVDLQAIRSRLLGLRFEQPMRLRLLVGREGRFEVQHIDLPRAGDGAVSLAVAKEPVDSNDVFLYHKTTRRAVYERAKAGCPDADDVLLFNERGEVTESCIANVVVELGGRRLTPPVSCGLLAGTFRSELLERGEIEEGIITLEDLRRADSVSLINSVRRRQRAELVS